MKSKKREAGMSNNLIEVKDLKKYFPIYGGLMLKCVGLVKAVDGVSSVSYTHLTLPTNREV